MRVFVLVAIRHDANAGYPPSVWHLQHRVGRLSPNSLRATSEAFLWTRDAFFQSLHRVAWDGDGHSTPLFWYFTALLDVAGCEEDVEVVAMVVRDLCRAWPGAAAHVEVCRTKQPDTASTPSAASSALSKTSVPAADVLRCLEREETLLVMLADFVEADAATQDTYLRRWGVADAWDYTQALRGRCWFGEAGYVALLPPEVAGVVEVFLLRELAIVWPSMCSVANTALTTELETELDDALALAVLEKDLTRHLSCMIDTQLAPQRLYDGNAHRAVVAVPPTVALFVSKLPSHLLHACVLTHTHDQPLLPFTGHAVKARSSVARSTHDSNALGADDCEEDPIVMPAACTSDVCFPPASMTNATSASVLSANMRFEIAAEESQRLANVFHEYDILLSNHGAVRLPLPPMARHVFTLLLCQSELPATLMAPFVRRHAAAIAESEGGRCVPTEEEIVLGIKVTWAVQRWTALMRSRLASHAGAPQPLPVYPLWERAEERVSDDVAAWVRRTMRSVEGETRRLTTSEEDVNFNAEASHAAPPELSLSVMQRQNALRKLEQRLFAPRPLSFRGSSTEWLVRAVRDVEAHFAQVPTSLMEEEMSLDERQRTKPSTAASLAKHREADALLVPEKMNAARSSDSDEAVEDDEESEDRSDSTSEVDAAEALLMAQMQELEAMVQRGSPPASPGAADAATSADDVAPWLKKEDMVHVSQNELFLQHVQLLGAELAKEE